jgi:hypothetical protein
MRFRPQHPELLAQLMPGAHTGPTLTMRWAAVPIKCFELM